MSALLAERGVRFVSFDDWAEVDRIEMARGEEQDRPRVKFITADAMWKALGDRSE